MQSTSQYLKWHTVGRCIAFTLCLCVSLETPDWPLSGSRCWTRWSKQTGHGKGEEDLGHTCNARFQTGYVHERQTCLERVFGPHYCMDALRKTSFVHSPQHKVTFWNLNWDDTRVPCQLSKLYLLMNVAWEACRKFQELQNGCGGNLKPHKVIYLFPVTLRVKT